MKTCLLVCDHVAPAFEPIDGAYPEMFQKLLPELDLVPYFVCDGHLPAIDEFDHYICTGSKCSVYDDEDWIHKLLSFTERLAGTGKKFVGICFGHQLIAQALDGEVTPAPAGWNIGVHEFTVGKEKLWMTPANPQFNIVMLCQDQVSLLPSDAEVLAQSKVCPVGMFQIGEEFLAIQGHPEFSKTYNQAVYTSRVERIGSEKVMAADHSLKKNLDQSLLRSWMMNFLKS